METATAVTKMFRSAAGRSHFQAKLISWSTRTRGSVPRIWTKMKTKTNVLPIIQTSPETHAALMKAQPRNAPTTSRLKRMNPMARAFSVLTRLDRSQNGSPSTIVPTTGANATRKISPRPRPPGSRLSVTGNGQSNGAFQPPKKSTTLSAETTNTFTYSAKKKKPKRMPEYSVAKPATSSWSASVMSSGVRFASAVAAMKKMMNPRGCFQMFQSNSDLACCCTMAVSYTHLRAHETDSYLVC